MLVPLETTFRKLLFRLAGRGLQLQNKVQPSLDKVGFFFAVLCYACLALAVYSAIFWFALRMAHLKHEVFNAFLSWLDNKPHYLIVATALTLAVWSTLIVVIMALGHANTFTDPKQREDRWLVLAMQYFIYNEALLMLCLWIAKTRYGLKEFPHPQYTEVILRYHFTLLIMIGGIALYLLKKRAILIFGISEVAIGVLVNLALIQKINFSQLPHVTIPLSDATAIGAFTYVLSRGMANIAEGVGKLREKYLGKLTSSTAMPPEPNALPEDTTGST